MSPDAPAPRAHLVANWKMNPTTRDEAVSTASSIATGARDRHLVRTVVCPPFPWLDAVAHAVAGTPVEIGAQDCFWEPGGGAYTGEVSVAMLSGWCRTVIVGHSERRRILGETDAEVAKKAAAVIAAGMEAVVCVGEDEDQYAAGATQEVVSEQVRLALAGVAADDARLLSIAYEPIWAIGTGRSADPEHAYHTMRQVRRIAGECIGAVAASIVRVLYGGSVSAANVESFVELPHCDGCLVGGASLKPDEFSRMADVTQAVYAASGR